MCLVDIGMSVLFYFFCLGCVIAVRMRGSVCVYVCEYVWDDGKGCLLVSFLRGRNV
jgi:hypothetical protein